MFLITILHYYVIYYEKFKKVFQQTEKEALMELSLMTAVAYG